MMYDRKYNQGQGEESNKSSEAITHYAMLANNVLGINQLL